MIDAAFYEDQKPNQINKQNKTKEKSSQTQQGGYKSNDFCIMVTGYSKMSRYVFLWILYFLS